MYLWWFIIPVAAVLSHDVFWHSNWTKIYGRSHKVWFYPEISQSKELNFYVKTQYNHAKIAILSCNGTKMHTKLQNIWTFIGSLNCTGAVSIKTDVSDGIKLKVNHTHTHHSHTDVWYSDWIYSGVFEERVHKASVNMSQEYKWYIKSYFGWQEKVSIFCGTEKVDTEIVHQNWTLVGIMNGCENITIYSMYPDYFKLYLEPIPLSYGYMDTTNGIYQYSEEDYEIINSGIFTSDTPYHDIYINDTMGMTWINITSPYTQYVLINIVEPRNITILCNNNMTLYQLDEIATWYILPQICTTSYLKSTGTFKMYIVNTTYPLPQEAGDCFKRYTAWHTHLPNKYLNFSVVEGTCTEEQYYIQSMYGQISNVDIICNNNNGQHQLTMNVTSNWAYLSMLCSYLELRPPIHNHIRVGYV